MMSVVVVFLKIHAHLYLNIQEKKFYFVGNLIAMGIVQGSSGIPYLAPPVYDYLCGATLESLTLTVEDVPSFEVKEFLEKVGSCLMIFL